MLGTIQRNGYSYIPDENGTKKRKIFKLKFIHIMQYLSANKIAARKIHNNIEYFLHKSNKEK